MAKSASASAEKYVTRAGAAAPDYVSGAESTSKDQSQAAIAGKANWQAALTAAFGRGAFEKGLAKSGKNGWLSGIKNKGGNRYGEGVQNSQAKYATNSGAYDPARNAASNLPRGPKGSEQNFARSKAVGMALRTAKLAR